jgi:hypothetical protein
MTFKDLPHVHIKELVKTETDKFQALIYHKIHYNM